MKRLWRSHYILILFVLPIGFGAFGCRSTRQNMSSWPGLGWVAPREDGMDFEQITSHESGLVAPSEESTPVTPYSAAKGKAKDVAATYDQEYPNTGYPATHSNGGSGSFGETTRSTTAKGQRSGERGFYNDRYNEYAGSSGSENKRSGYDDASKDRYSPDAAAGQANPEQANQGTIDRYRNSFNNTPNVSEKASDQVGRARDTADQYQSDADRVDETTRYASDPLQRGTDAVQDRMNQVDEAIVDRVDGTINNVADRFSPPANAINESSNSAIQDDSRNQATGDYGTNGADSGYSNTDADAPAAESVPTDDRAQPVDARPDTEQQPTQSRDPAKPWRPGSTSSYPLSRYTSDPTTPASTVSPTVQPVSYRQNSQSSDAGWRHHTEASPDAREYRISGEYPVRR